MPRRSAADLSVLRVDGRPDRLVPPATLAPDARATFLAIVKSVEPEHFRPGDVHLLCRMAVACVWSERAEHGLELDGGIRQAQPVDCDPRKANSRRRRAGNEAAP